VKHDRGRYIVKSAKQVCATIDVLCVSEVLGVIRSDLFRLFLGDTLITGVRLSVSYGITFSSMVSR
jgi:hypothetical protein